MEKERWKRQCEKLRHQKLRWKKKETSRTWRSNAGARILSDTVGNETPGTSTRETETSETAMEEKKRRECDDQMLMLEFCQKQWEMKRRGHQHEKLERQKLRWKKKKCREHDDQMSTSSMTRISETEMNEGKEETSRTWQPDTNAWEDLSEIMNERKCEIRCRRASIRRAIEKIKKMMTRWYNVKRINWIV